MAKDYDLLYRLYIERLAGTISREEEHLLQHTLYDDPQAKAIWEELEQEGKKTGVQEFVDAIQPEEALEQFREAKLKRERKKRIHRIRFIAAAAAILAFIISGSIWLFSENKRITDNQAIALQIKKNKSAVQLQTGSGQVIDLTDSVYTGEMKLGSTVLNIESNGLHFNSSDTVLNQIAVPGGGSYMLTLSDGTVVTLNADSKFKFPFRFGNATRDVYIEGEAYFKVAKDRVHPFIVHTPLTKVEVVGTAFNINTYTKGTVTTALIEGQVRTTPANGGADQAVLPGHAAVYNAGTGFNITTIDTDDVTAWMKGLYYFHDVSLQELISSMSRIYGVTITIDNASTLGKSVSGVMNKENLPELLDDLRSTTGIQYYYAGKTLHIY